MNISFSEKLTKDLKKIKKKEPVLFKQIQKQLVLFENDKSHPSVRNHKLTGNLNNIWSISINRSIRMTYIQLPNESVYFFDIGKHEEVYS